jgi:hypothetical protein
MLDAERDLREQGIITKYDTVKDDVFVAGYRRIRIYTHPREYKYMESDMDQIARLITLEDADPWQKQVLEILEQYPDD